MVSRVQRTTFCNTPSLQTDIHSTDARATPATHGQSSAGVIRAPHAWSELHIRGQSSAPNAWHPSTSRWHLPPCGAPPAPTLKLGAPSLLLKTEGLGQASDWGGCLGSPQTLPPPRMRGPWVHPWDMHPRDMHPATTLSSLGAVAACRPGAGGRQKPSPPATIHPFLPLPGPSICFSCLNASLNANCSTHSCKLPAQHPPPEQEQTTASRCHRLCVPDGKPRHCKQTCFAAEAAQAEVY